MLDEGKLVESSAWHHQKRDLGAHVKASRLLRKEKDKPRRRDAGSCRGAVRLKHRDISTPSCRR
jgi:hypothetical protein